MGQRIANGPNEFDLARKRAEAQAKKQNQISQDALKRRAAATGNLGSGAFIKQQQQAIRETGQQLSQANEGIDAAERTENRRVREIQEAREFQRGERKASQDFAAEQSALQMAQQAEQFQKQYGLSKAQYETGKNQWRKGYELQLDQFAFNKKTTEEQKAMAQKAADLALKQFDFQKKTEAFNAAQSALNQLLKPGQTISEGQANALLGILGPDVLSLFQDDFSALFGTTTAPAANPQTQQNNQNQTASSFGGGGYHGTYQGG